MRSEFLLVRLQEQHPILKSARSVLHSEINAHTLPSSDGNNKDVKWTNTQWNSCWDTSTLSQVSNYDGVVLKIYLDHKFQWPQEDFNCKSFAYEVVA